MLKQRINMIYRNCPICGENKTVLFDNQKYFTREFKDHGPVVVVCSFCNMVYLNPIMSEKEYGSFYDNDEQKIFVNSLIKEDYNKKIYIQEKYRLKYVENIIKKGSILLDVGSGFSTFANSISKKVSSVYAVEPSKCRRIFLENNGITVFNQKIENLKIDFQVDIITMFQVIEHIVDIKRCLRNLHNLIKNDGIIIIETPNVLDFLLWQKSYRGFYFQNAHCNYFSPTTLKAALNLCGFRIVKNIKLQRYSFDNHMWWLFNKSPGKMKEFEWLNVFYSYLLKKTIKYDTIFVIARKI